MTGRDKGILANVQSYFAFIKANLKTPITMIRSSNYKVEFDVVALKFFWFPTQTVLGTIRHTEKVRCGPVLEEFASGLKVISNGRCFFSSSKRHNFNCMEKIFLRS